MWKFKSYRLAITTSLLLTMTICSDSISCPPRPIADEVMMANSFSDQFYVDSENGDDDWQGTIEVPNEEETNGPFQTLRNAIMSIRQQRTDTSVPAVLYVREGMYFVESPINLNDMDSNLSIEGYPYDDRAIITGGYKITADEFSSADGKIFQAKYTGVCWRQAFLGTRRLVRARKPNLANWKGNEMTGEGPYLTIKDLLQPTPDCDRQGSGGYRQNNCPKANKDGFVFEKGDLNPQWYRYDKAEILVFQSWIAERGEISYIGNDDKVNFSTPLIFPVGQHPLPSGWRYIVEHIYEELDAEGEFYCDDDKEIMYVIPPNGDFEGDDVFVGITDSIFRAQGVDSLSFIDLSFRDGHDKHFSGYNARPGLIDFEKCSNILVQGCEFFNVGYTAIYMETCAGVTVNENFFYDIGNVGVHAEFRDGSSVEEANRNLTITKNTFIGCGVVDMYQPCCISVKGVKDIYVTDNEISRTPYAGMRIGWQQTFKIDAVPPGEHIFYIKRNHVHDFGMRILCDFGGIYLSSNPGCGEKDGDQSICHLHVLVENNIVHNGWSYEYGALGVYSDTAVSSLIVQKNWLYNLGDTSINFHCGQYNYAINNMIFHSSERRVFGTCNAIVGQGEPPRQILYFLWNAIYVNNTKALMFRNSDHWTFDVPKCEDNDYFFNPISEEQSDNFFPQYLSFEEWQDETGNDLNSIIKDPLYWSIPYNDYRLRDNSPAYALGIESVDLRSVRSDSGVCSGLEL